MSICSGIYLSYKRGKDKDLLKHRIINHSFYIVSLSNQNKWNTTMKQIIFMKGELDTRPTTFQERLCQARNWLKSSCIWFSEKWKRTKSRQDAFPVYVCSFTESGCLSGKLFLSLDGLVREILLVFSDQANLWCFSVRKEEELLWARQQQCLSL